MITARIRRSREGNFRASSRRGRRLTSLDWGLLGLALVTVLATVWALSHQPVTPAQSSTSGAWTDAFADPIVPDIPPLTPMDAAVGQLRERSHPWTMAVLGDSTGNEDREWVHLVAAELAERTGRPMEIHTWSVDSESYGPTTRHAGRGAPIVVWNGSAAGKHTGYSLDHSRSMIPERPDVLIVNHGHNQADAHDTSAEIASIANWARRAWKKPPALAVTLQNSRTDARTAEHARIVTQLREDVQADDAATIIDVFSAFAASPDVSLLLQADGFHPSPAGEALWADVVWRSLGFDRVLP